MVYLEKENLALHSQSPRVLVVTVLGTIGLVHWSMANENSRPHLRHTLQLKVRANSRGCWSHLEGVEEFVQDRKNVDGGDDYPVLRIAKFEASMIVCGASDLIQISGPIRLSSCQDITSAKPG